MSAFLINTYINAAGGFQNTYSLNFDYNAVPANQEFVRIFNQSNAIDTAIRDTTPNFSVSGWFKLKSTDSGRIRRLFSKYDNFAARDRCFIITINTSNKIQVYGQFNTITSSVNLETLQAFTDADGWVHWCFVYDSSQTTVSTIAKLYVNGVEVVSFSSQSVSTTNKFFFNQTTEANRAYVGLVDYAGASALLPSFGTSGNIDEMTFWDKSLSSAEVTQIYNSGDAYDISLMTSYSANCLAWWRMGDNSGDNWDGSKWNIINVKGTASSDLQSTNLIEADRVTDVP